jgi:hypothetical protein
LRSRREAVPLSDVADHAGVERLSGAGEHASGVERVGDTGVGVMIEQPVDFGDHVRGGGPQLGCREWQRHGERGVLPAGEPDLCGDLLAAVEGDVGDEQAHHAFTFSLRGARVGPQGGEVGGQRGDALLVLLGQWCRVGGLPFVVVLGGG